MISSFIEVNRVKKQMTSTAGLMVIGSVSLGLSACATDEEYWETADFGDSVRNTIALQTDYAGSAGTGLDGAKAATIYKAYVEDVAVPADVGLADREVVGDVRFNVNQ